MGNIDNDSESYKLSDLIKNNPILKILLEYLKEEENCQPSERQTKLTEFGFSNNKLERQTTLLEFGFKREGTF